MSVIKFTPKKQPGTADAVLEAAVGDFSELIVLGYDTDGNIDARVTNGMIDGGEILWVVEEFKRRLMAGEYSE